MLFHCLFTETNGTSVYCAFAISEAFFLVVRFGSTLISWLIIAEYETMNNTKLLDKETCEFYVTPNFVYFPVAKRFLSYASIGVVFFIVAGIDL